MAFEALDQAKLSLNEALSSTKPWWAGRRLDGWPTTRQPIQRFEVATEMIRVSDNTATNLLIKSSVARQPQQPFP